MITSIDQSKSNDFTCHLVKSDAVVACTSTEALEISTQVSIWSKHLPKAEELVQLVSDINHISTTKLPTTAT